MKTRKSILFKVAFSNSLIILLVFFLVFGSMAAIAVAVLSMLYINRRTLRPIQRLGETMAAVGPGTTAVTLPVTGDDEVARLTLAFNRMMETINDLIFSEYENTIKLQQSQLRHRELQLLYLRSQINPHFLYNTLDTIRMKAALEGNDEVAELILMLVDFFRFSIGNNATTVNLAHEVQLMRIYLRLMKQRYPSITDRYEVDESLNDLLIPSFILQPLVENSIKHGLKHTGYRGCITLRVYRDPKVPTDVLIEVVDDGAGISDERLQDVRRLLGTEESGQLGAHIGLSNIRERLCTFYPGRFSLEMRPNSGQGVTVSIRIDTTIAMEQDPLRLEERDGIMGTGEAAAD